MKEIDAWLIELLMSPIRPGETRDDWARRVIKAIKGKILESYRNGQRAKRSTRKVEPSPTEK